MLTFETSFDVIPVVRNLFHSYWFGLPVTKRAEVARAIGASVGHLNNVAYGIRPLAPELCAPLESLSRGAVCRWHMRPDDWWRLWPELVGRAAAPSLPHGVVSLAMPTDADIEVARAPATAAGSAQRSWEACYGSRETATPTEADERNPSRLVAVAVERERRTQDLGRQARGAGGRA